MYVGLDSLPLAAPLTGVGHYTFELARHLALIAPDSQFELVSPFPIATPHANSDSSPSNLRIIASKANVFRRKWFAIGLPLHARRVGYDIFHGTNFEVPLLGKCPSVMTLHDLSLFLHPNTHEERLVRRSRRRLPMMVRAAARVITHSEAIRREICEHLKVEPLKVIAIPDAPRSIFRPKPAAETIDVRQRLKIEDNFILAVGTIEPRKNLRLLLRAFEVMTSSTSLRPQLVLVGKRGWLTHELFDDVKKSEVKDRLIFTDYLSDEDLCALYSSCSVFVYPSIYEGFGLPPLEAMACGAPVITTRIPSIVETVGADTVRLVSPTDAEELTRNIVELLNDEDERRSRALLGRERVARFTWEKTARATLAVYESLLAK